MPTSEELIGRIDRLRADLVSQGGRVRALVEYAFEALTKGDEALAQAAVDRDDDIDRVDVEIERACVKLLGDASRAGVGLGDEQFRAVLTIVKVNNELERAADRGVDIAESVGAVRRCCGDVPPVFEVMANSVVGILRDTCLAYERNDADLAKLVLRSEDTVEAFEREVIRGIESQLADGSIGVDAAFSLHGIAGACIRMADYCTNIAEQVLYSATGKVVRHTGSGWVEIDR